MSSQVSQLGGCCHGNQVLVLLVVRQLQVIGQDKTARPANSQREIAQLCIVRITVTEYWDYLGDGQYQ